MDGRQSGGFFGGFGASKVPSSYAVPVNEHVALKPSTQYTL
jgi:hypothetical protein